MGQALGAGIESELGRVAVQRLETSQGRLTHLDRLVFDEAWIGEHHSAGAEIISSPENFIATVATRTKTI